MALTRTGNKCEDVDAEGSEDNTEQPNVIERNARALRNRLIYSNAAALLFGHTVPVYVFDDAKCRLNVKTADLFLVL
jgi:hypothetical protein